MITRVASTWGSVVIGETRLKTWSILLFVWPVLTAMSGCAQRDAPSSEARGPRTVSADSASRVGFPNGEVIDLTYTFDESTIYWPTEDGFRLEIGFAGRTELGYYYTANRFTAAEHGGTHIDAPIHFYEDRKTVDALSLDRLMGEGVVVDVSDQCGRDRDYQVGIADLRTWEKTHGRQLVDVIVMLRTGFGQHWPNRKDYLGTDARGEEAVAQLHFPGLHPDAARWLVEQRMIKAVGIDTASIDYGQSKRFESHVRLFSRNVPALENVANLDKLPDQDFWVIALPMKIGKGSGGPTRIVAILRE